VFLPKKISYFKDNNKIITRNCIEIFTKFYGKIPIVIQGSRAGKAVPARGVLADILKLSEKIKSTELLWV
jgi:homoserine dehydrogenase